MLIFRYLPTESLAAYVDGMLKSMGDVLHLYNTTTGQKIKLISVTNNASWGIGQLGIKCSGHIRISMEPIYKELTDIFDNKLNKGLAQNVSITIGKLGLISPECSVDYISTFIKPFCISLRYLPHSAEKHNAFSGVCESIKHNPKGVIESFDYLGEAFAEYKGCSNELESTFKGILQSFKISAGDSWAQFFSGLPEELQSSMKSRFEID